MQNCFWYHVDKRVIPYRTIVFIGINVCEIRNCRNRKIFNPLKNISPQVLFAWSNIEEFKHSVIVVAQAEIQTWVILITGPTLYQLSYTKSLGLIAKHWAREYREKTTPSRILMPCNLSSCRVGLMFTWPHFKCRVERWSEPNHDIRRSDLFIWNGFHVKFLVTK